MKVNPPLIERCAKGIPGEQTVLCGIKDVAKENGYSVHEAFAEHPVGMPVSAYRDGSGALQVVQRDGLCHALVTGSTGCGKSMRCLVNLLFNLDGRHSVIVSDIKGELYRCTAEYLKGVYGEDNVKYMDFICPEVSEVLFNPIASIARAYRDAELFPGEEQRRRDEALSELKRLFDTLFPIRSEKDMNWDEGARGFIYGIAVGLFEDMLLTKEQEEKTGRRRVLPDQINFEAISEVFYSFEYSDEFHDHGFFSSREQDDRAWRYVRGIINDARSTRACYLQLVEGYLNTYSYPDIRTLTLADNFDISTLGDIPQVLFLTYDITDERMRTFVNRYIIKSLDVLKKKAIGAGAPLNVPVLYLLDEFPTLQPDPIFSTIFSVGRGWNIFITAVVQDFTQLETTYSPGVAQQIRNNCDLTFFLGSNDVHTIRSVKEQIGRHIIPDPASYLRGEVRFIEEYVVSEDELMHRLVPGTAYVTISCHMPLKGEFALYYECPEYTKFQSAAVRQTAMIDFDDTRYHYDVSWLKKPRRRRGFLND